MKQDLASTGAPSPSIGPAGTAWQTAGGMVGDAGVDIRWAETSSDALATLRESGADMAMIEIRADVRSFIAGLRRERLAVPVFARGFDAPAELAVAAIRAGAKDYFALPSERELVAAAIVAVASDNRIIGGTGSGFERAINLGLTLATSQVPILISGEGGCGKQLLARAIHGASGRTGPFVVVDCADMDADEISAALFGNPMPANGDPMPANGDASGGSAAAAEHGTLFIRQVSTLPLACQSRLAQLLTARNSRSPGTGLRVIASTSVDLRARIGDGRFRANLLAGLGLIQIALPPLRERRTDIAALAAHFVVRFAELEGVPVPALEPAAVALLENHDWADNVRGLENVVHRAVLLSRGGTIGPSAIVLADGSALGGPAPTVSALGGPAPTVSAASEQYRSLVGSTVEDVERALILETLRHCRGNRTSASSILGISVRTMRNKLKIFEAGARVSA